MSEPAKWIPRVGLKFKTPDDAWKFCLAYGGRTGFDVRKRGSNLSKIDGKATSCRFVCSNEGFRRKGQNDHVPKLFRAETRTNCDARMVLSLNRLTGSYEVIEVRLDNMRYKVHKQTWLDSIYKLREKWAECYMRDVFSLGVRSTQLSETFNNALKIHLKSDFHIVRFLNHFERAVEVKRSKELQSEFEARKNIPRIKMSTLMLVEASKVYTPVSFEAFQGEYERSMATCAKALDGNNKYVVSIGSLDRTYEEERIVTGDPLTQTVACTCGIFQRVGILCAHGLKVLDLMNIKLLSVHYVLKRWTRDAQKGSILNKQGRNVVADPQLEASLRVKNMSYKFLTLAKKIANSEECCLMLEDAIDSIGPKLEDKLNASTSATNEPSNETRKKPSKEPCKEQENIDPNVQQTADFLNAAQLKKKEVQSKNTKRTKTFMEKLRKGKRKPTKSAPSTTKGAKQPKKDDRAVRVQPQVEVENDDNKKGENMLHEEYNVIDSFTQLLTAPTCDDGSLYDGNIF